MYWVSSNQDNQNCNMLVFSNLFIIIIITPF